MVRCYSYRRVQGGGWRGRRLDHRWLTNEVGGEAEEEGWRRDTRGGKVGRKAGLIVR
jgi:hypothetical protein